MRYVANLLNRMVDLSRLFQRPLALFDSSVRSCIAILSVIIFATLSSCPKPSCNSRAMRRRSLSWVAISLLDSFRNSEFNISSCRDLCDAARQTR